MQVKEVVRVFINEMFSYAPNSELGVSVTPRGVHLTLEQYTVAMCVFLLSQNLVHFCPNSLGTLKSSWKETGELETVMVCPKGCGILSLSQNLELCFQEPGYHFVPSQGGSQAAV